MEVRKKRLAAARKIPVSRTLSPFGAEFALLEDSRVSAVVSCFLLLNSLFSEAAIGLTVENSLSFAPGENKVTSLALKGNTLYVGMNMVPGTIVRVDTKTMKKIGSPLRLSEDENSIYSLLVVEDHLYAGLYTSPGRVVKIHADSFTRVETLTLPEGQNWVSSLASSNGFLYASLRMWPGKIAKIDLKTLKQVDLIELASGENNIYSMATKDGYLYAGIAMRPGGVAKIDLETFREVQSLRFRLGEDYSQPIAISENLLFAGFYSKPGGIAKVDLTTFEEVAVSARFSQGEDNVWSLIVHLGSVYAGLDTRPGKVIRLDLDLRRLDTLSLGEGDGGVYAFAPLNEFLVCGVYSSPGKIMLLRPQELVTPSFLFSVTLSILSFALLCLTLWVLKSKLRKSPVVDRTVLEKAQIRFSFLLWKCLRPLQDFT